MATPTLQVPAHIAKRIAERQAAGKKTALTEAFNSASQFPYPRISIRGSKFRLVEDGVETTVGVSLDVVIAAANPKTSKVYFSKAFNPNDMDVMPDCQSSDGVKPDAVISSPVCETCALCPNNVLGSKINPGTGEKSKLCGDVRYLAVVPAADPSKIYSLSVPVSGMKALREHVKFLGNYGTSPEETVTTLSFDDEASYPKLIFTHKGFIPEKALNAIDRMIESTVELKEITREVPVGTLNKALAAPVTATKLAAPKPEPVPDPEPEFNSGEASFGDFGGEEEEPPKPVSKAKPKAQAAKAKPKAQAAAPRQATVFEEEEDDDSVIETVMKSDDTSDLEKALDSMFD